MVANAPCRNVLQDMADTVRVAVKLVNAVLEGIVDIDAGTELRVHRAAVMGQHIPRSAVHVEDDIIGAGVGQHDEVVHMIQHGRELVELLFAVLQA
jgi:hypothetical protein